MAGLSNRERLAEIEKQAAELENSEFNTAKLTAENQDYYDQVFLNAAKAQREAEYGFSAAQKAEARQNFSENSNLAIQNAQNAGGGTLQNYINANMNTNANKFATGMASQDAALKMQKQQQAEEQQQVAQAGQLTQQKAQEKTMGRKETWNASTIPAVQAAVQASAEPVKPSTDPSTQPKAPGSK
jgi:hypothetical protein